MSGAKLIYSFYIKWRALLNLKMNFLSIHLTVNGLKKQRKRDFQTLRFLEFGKRLSDLFMIGVAKKELYLYTKWLTLVQQNLNLRHLIFMGHMRMKMNQL